MDIPSPLPSETVPSVKSKQESNTGSVQGGTVVQR